MSVIPTEITFFERLIPSILSGKKVITIRDESESHYKPGTEVELFANEHRTHYGKLKILSVSELQYSDINEYHAQQEGMALAVLKTLIKEIYPTTNSLYLIEYQLIK
ncbi:N(4)-acetylcytidine aminohydrolase [Proteus hauseri]|uniref:N(4)-acetylcytidine aminohydrolase n=1 Tax=Proteus hauseri TaxID=183417 RepID=UPI0032DA6AD2